MNRQQRRQYEKYGKSLVKRNPEIANAIRTTTLREAEPENETQRLIAKAYFDYQQGKITKQRFDELTGHLLIEPLTE
jgi:hypothetical protein